MKLIVAKVCAVVLMLGFVGFALAAEFNSTNFKVLEPVMVPASRSTSANFQLTGVISQIGAGESASASFGVNAGFLYFPFVTTPVVSAAAGVEKVDLSWTTSSGFVGWTVSGYSVGQSSVSGGPYSYASVGNVTSYSATGLTGGSTYFFVIRPQDAFGNAIATSSEVSAVATSAGGVVIPPAGGGGGGGGGAGGAAAGGSNVVNFMGRAYPSSVVTLLKDGQVAATTVAGGDANFAVSLSGLTAGSYVFSVFGTDNKSNTSPPLAFPLTVTEKVTINVTGIFIAPTIGTDKSEVKKGDNITFFGQSAPKTEITIAVNSNDEFFVKAPSDKDGIYLYAFDTSPLELGSHSAKSKAAISNEISSFGNAAGFIVGNKNVAAVAIVKKFLKGDLNNDGHVNLVDFSIAAYWYRRPLSAQFKPVEIERLNSDGKIDLVDFSIMAYYWTG